MKERVNIARNLRKRQTTQEKKLWFWLQDRRLFGFKFRRQVRIDNYIADFCCFRKRLIIELDGSPHNKSVNIIMDRERETYLRKQGFKMLRFWNSDLDRNPKKVLEKILLNLIHPSSALRASSPARGEEKRK